jgi:hypothetical protein
VRVPPRAGQVYNPTVSPSLFRFFFFAFSFSVRSLQFWRLEFGVLGFWGFRVLRLWGFGVLEFWSSGFLVEFANFDFFVFRAFYHTLFRSIPAVIGKSGEARIVRLKPEQHLFFSLLCLCAISRSPAPSQYRTN